MIGDLIYSVEVAIVRCPGDGADGSPLGVPTEKPLASAYWRKRTPPPADMNPDRDGCGLLWCAPVAPLEGGHAQRLAQVSIDTLLKHGFEPLLSHNVQAPIIVTFRMPADPKFHFQEFYDRLKDRGYVIYPGKLTVADSFRMGCIGRLYPEHMKGALAAVREVLDELRVSNGGPALAAE